MAALSRHGQGERCHGNGRDEAEGTRYPAASGRRESHEARQWADDAANKEARDVEPLLVEMATTYSKTNGQYNVMMERVHKFIAHVKEAED